MKQIKNARELRRAVKIGHREFRIALQGGVYSAKTINLTSGRRFRVVNHIDESVQMLTVKELRTLSNIGEAMQKGAFICEPLPGEK